MTWMRRLNRHLQDRLHWKQLQVSINESIKDLRADMNGFKEDLKSDIEKVKTKVEKVEDPVRLQGLRTKEFEDKVNQGVVDEAVRSKMEKLEHITNLSDRLNDACMRSKPW